MRWLRWAVTLATTGGLGMAAGAAEDLGGEPWALSLTAQLKSEKRCDVQTTQYVRELPTAEGNVYSGRVRCIDGREFNFSQSKPHLKFEITACEPAAC